MDINLTLTVDEVNVILASLGKHPFDQIAALVQKIKVQGEPQVAAQAPTAPVPAQPAE
jgi:hypothetical protein